MKCSDKRRQSFQSELRRYVVTASQISSQKWHELGISDELYPHAVASSSLDVTAECITSLLVIRLVVLTTSSFKNLSTETVCHELLSSTVAFEVPAAITENVVQELRRFVVAMLKGYNKVPYHNYKHAYHVLISASTLMDMILKNSAHLRVERIPSGCPPPFEKDGLLQLALLFSALIHDTEHQGVPNAQLINENNPLAIQYNDQSVAEQRSLTVAFLELLQPAYDNLRGVIFPKPNTGDDYRRFRGAVTSLVLSTDIATPSRGKEVRDRWESVVKRSTGWPSNTQDTRKPPNGLPLLSPPRDHPTPSRRRPKVTMVSGLSKTNRADSRNNWIDCCPTPSTHFPRSTAGSSMHDSLAFWWFTPEQLTEDEDSSSVKTFSEDDTSATASLSNCERTNLPDQAGINDFNASLSLFSENEKSTLDETSAFSDCYPHESTAFQFSCSTFSDDSSHHLLSHSRVFKPSRSFSRSSGSSVKDNRREDDLPSAYREMSTSGNESIELKPKSMRNVFSACTPKRRTKKAAIFVDHIRVQAPSNGLNVDSESTLVSSVLSPDLTSTDASSTNSTPVPVDFNSYCNVEFLETSGIFEHQSRAENDEVDSKGESHEEMALKSEVEFEEAPLNDEVESAPVEAPDEMTRSLCLIENILLVADVSHTMQSWDTMNMFALRLSKEIIKSIKKGRSGGIKDDPLDDWYSNQSAFLHGYILPLAQRLEQIGTMPPAEDNTTDGFLSSQIRKNLERWQEQGHDVIAGWRKDREQRSTKRKPKEKKSQKEPKNDRSGTKKNSRADPKGFSSKTKYKSESEKKKSAGKKLHSKEREHL